MSLRVGNFFSELKELMLNDFSVITLVISTILYLFHVVSVFHSEPAIVYTLSILLFGAYDRLSYHHVLQQREGKERTAYRIVQHVFLAIVGAVLWSLSPIAFIMFIISWLFGVVDCLYYVIGKDWNFVKYEEMYWLWWMPWTWVGIPKNGRNLLGISVVVFFASIFILAVLK